MSKSRSIGAAMKLDRDSTAPNKKEAAELLKLADIKSNWSESEISAAVEAVSKAIRSSVVKGLKVIYAERPEGWTANQKQAYSQKEYIARELGIYRENIAGWGAFTEIPLTSNMLTTIAVRAYLLAIVVENLEYGGELFKEGKFKALEKIAGVAFVPGSPDKWQISPSLRFPPTSTSPVNGKISNPIIPPGDTAVQNLASAFASSKSSSAKNSSIKPAAKKNSASGAASSSSSKGSKPAVAKNTAFTKKLTIDHYFSSSSAPKASSSVLGKRSLAPISTDQSSSEDSEADIFSRKAKKPKN